MGGLARIAAAAGLLLLLWATSRVEAHAASGFSPAKPISDYAYSDSSEDAVWPALEADRSGTVVVTYATSQTLIDGRDTGADYDVVYVRSEDGGVTWSPAKLLNHWGNETDEIGDERNPTVATDFAGNWMIVFDSDVDRVDDVSTGHDRDVWFATSSDDGITWSRSRLLQSSFLDDSAEDYFPRVAYTGAQGGFIVGWQTTNLTLEHGGIATRVPTLSPTSFPTSSPTTSFPTKAPTTSRPSRAPRTSSPTTSSPTLSPVSSVPSSHPTTSEPTVSPTLAPTTTQPTGSPVTSAPTWSPSETPTTSEPSRSPSAAPATAAPTHAPSVRPTTSLPTISPSRAPLTSRPTTAPVTSRPTSSPITSIPTHAPTVSPTDSPETSEPTAAPTTTQPSGAPTAFPTFSPTISTPTASPTTSRPSGSPVTSRPSASPTPFPTQSPTLTPPTRAPSTGAPSTSPVTSEPTMRPTSYPTKAPRTSRPTRSPRTSSPTLSPTFGGPSSAPVIPPSASPIPAATIEAPGEQGVQLTCVGCLPTDEFGVSIASLDVNGDDYPDFFVGAPGAGRVYLFYGRPESQWVTRGYAIDAVDALVIEGEIGFGASLAVVGDVNGDSWDDLFVGSPLERGELGGVYGFCGYRAVPSYAWSATCGKFLNEDTTLRRFGQTVVAAGDLNDDGLPDILVGAPAGPHVEVSSALVLFGWGHDGNPTTFPVASNSAGGSCRLNSLTPFGEYDVDDFGATLAAGGDFNGDGVDDVVVGAPKYFNGVETVGRVYIVTGFQNSTLMDCSAPVDPLLYAATTGLAHVLTGESSAKPVGRVLAMTSSRARSFDGDYLADVFVGLGESDGGTGKILWGRSLSLETEVPEETLMSPEATNPLGLSECFHSFALTDVNRDGFPDLIVGCPASAASEEGVVFVVFGQNVRGSSLTLPPRGGYEYEGYALQGTDPDQRLGERIHVGRTPTERDAFVMLSALSSQSVVALFPNVYQANPTTVWRSPSKSPQTGAPSLRPTTSEPTSSPLPYPTPSPTFGSPSASPTQFPTKLPTTIRPSNHPTTTRPSSAPVTQEPSASPATTTPTHSPSRGPTRAPTTSRPTRAPSTSEPTRTPSRAPTMSPRTSFPSKSPVTSQPTRTPSLAPATSAPSAAPVIAAPTTSPSASPSTSTPTVSPSLTPTISMPTASPATSRPSASPATSAPSSAPITSNPSSSPSRSPSSAPSTSTPSFQPSRSPSLAPRTSSPTESPTYSPTLPLLVTGNATYDDLVWCATANNGERWSDALPIDGHRSRVQSETRQVNIAYDETRHQVTMVFVASNLASSPGGEPDVLMSVSEGTFDPDRPEQYFNASNVASLEGFQPDDGAIDGEPGIAFAPSGEAVIVWHSNRDPERWGGDFDVFFTRRDPLTSQWSRAAPIHPGYASSDAGSDRYPSVAHNQVNAFAVVWYAIGSSLTGSDPDILLTVSTDGGKTWQYPAPLYSYSSVDPHNAHDGEIARISDNGANGFLVVWASRNYDVQVEGHGGKGLDFDIMYTLRRPIDTLAPTPDTFAPSSSPTPMPTYSAPMVESAVFSNDFTSIQVTFDSDTNGLILFPNKIFSCDALVRLTESCGDQETCAHTCVYLTPRRFVVQLSSKTNFPVVDGRLNVTSATNDPTRKLRHLTGNSPIVQETHRVVTVSPDAVVPTPGVQIRGPRHVGLCGPSAVELEGDLVNMGGRAPLETTWTLNNDPVLSNDTRATRLTVTKPATPQTYRFTLRAKNWLEQEAVSEVFEMVFSADAVATVTIGGPSFLSSFVDRSVDLSASVNLPQDCVSPDSGTTDYGFAYNWTIRDVATTELVEPRRPALGTRSHKVRFLPSSFVAGRTYEVECRVTTSIGASGFARVRVYVAPVPLIAVIAGSAVRTLEVNESFSLDAKRLSRDPNRVDPTEGLVFSWACVREDDTPCDLAPPAEAATTGIWSLPEGLNPSSTRSPYIFSVAVSSSLDPQLPPAHATSARVHVLSPAPPACPRPRLTLLSVPSVIPMVSTSPSGPLLACKTTSSGGTLTLGARAELDESSDARLVQHEWTREVYDDVLDDLVLESAGKYAAGLSASSRLNLMLSTSSLNPGEHYVFRLTSRLPCDPVGSFAQIGFTMNSGPKSGALTVSPAQGRSGLDVFTFRASSFEDPEGDLPITYAFVLLSDCEELFLSDFQAEPLLSTRLSQSGVALVYARDALGAEGTRGSVYFSTPLRVDELDLTTPPFDPTVVFQQLAQSGASPDDLVRSAFALVSASSGGGNGRRRRLQTVSNEVARFQRDTQARTLDIVLTARNETVASGTSTSATSLAQASTLSRLARIVVSDETTSHSESFVTELTSGVDRIARDARDLLGPSEEEEEDPLLASKIPSHSGPVLIESISSVLRLLHYVNGSVSVEALDTNLERVRETIFELSRLLLTGQYADGTTLALPGAELILVSAREQLRNVGGNTNRLILPDFDASKPATVFTLGPDLLTSETSRANETEEEEMDVVAVRFRFNVRELSGVSERVENRTSDVREILSLDFLTSKTRRRLHPRNLPEDSITYTVALSEEEVAELARTLEFPLDNETVSTRRFVPQCGYWSEEGAWSTFGCRSLGVSSEGVLTCGCNHASDYSAWRGFIDDVNRVVNPIIDLNVLGTIAVVVVGVLMPLLLVMWIYLVAYTRRKDKDDADVIHRGTFVLMSMNKIRYHHRQRRFFALLRANAHSVTPASVAKAQSGVESLLERLARQKEESQRAPRGWFENLKKTVYDFGKALYYESSFVGIFTRFDPFYERTQRVSVFVGVITGNLFAASFFFKLKTAKDLTPGLLFGSIILAALVVSIPVKITLRLLFRRTAAAMGSTMDRVAQIYRVSVMHHDVVPSYSTPAERADLSLLEAFKRMYIAKHRHKLLAQALAHQNVLDENQARVRKGLAPKWTAEDVLEHLLVWGPVILTPLAAVFTLAGLSVPSFAISLATNQTQSLRDSESPETTQILASLTVVSCLLTFIVGVTLHKHVFRNVPVHFFVLVLSQTTSTMLSFASTLLPVNRLHRNTAWSRMDAGLICFVVANALLWLAFALLAPACYIYLVREPDFVVRFPRTARQSRGLLEGHTIPSNVPQAFARQATSEVPLQIVRAGGTGGDEIDRDLEAMRAELRGESSSGSASKSLKEKDRKQAASGSTRKGPLSGDLSVTHTAQGGWVDAEEDPGASGGYSTHPMLFHIASQSKIAADAKRELIASHGFLIRELRETNGRVTPEIMKLAEEEYAGARVQLQGATALSRQAWRADKGQTYASTSSVELKRQQVRKQRSVLLKLAVVLSDEPSFRPRQPKARYSSNYLVLAWGVLLAYYAFTLIWSILWVFTLDQESKRAFEAQNITEYTQDELTRTSNAILLAWLLSAFLGVLIAYAVSEPIVLLMRYALLPLVVRVFGRPANDDEDDDEALVVAPEAKRDEEEAVQPEGMTKETAGKRLGDAGDKKQQTYRTVEGFFDFVADVVDAVS